MLTPTVTYAVETNTTPWLRFMICSLLFVVVRYSKNELLAVFKFIPFDSWQIQVVDERCNPFYQIHWPIQQIIETNIIY